MTAQVSRRLADNLHANVMPRLSGNGMSVVHVLFGFVEGVKVAGSLIRIVCRAGQ